MSFMTSDGHYHNPFCENGYDLVPEDGIEHPRTLVEIKMCAISNAIREKPRWWEKIKNPEIVAKWRKEILEYEHDGKVGSQEKVPGDRNDAHDDGEDDDEEEEEEEKEGDGEGGKGGGKGGGGGGGEGENPDILEEFRKITEGMFDYIVGELAGYAALRDEATGIEVGPYDRTWKSGSLIPSDLRQELLSAIEPFENVPEGQKDWHPRSNKQVLNLVHPSLYPVVYNRSLYRSNNGGLATVIEPPKDDSYCISAQFQWLPSDFSVSDHGEVTLSSPYINNVHPTHHAHLYRVIPQILQRAILMFERVLSDLSRPLIPWKVKSFPLHDHWFHPDGLITTGCIWPNQRPYEGLQDDATEMEIDAWYIKQDKILPKVEGPYEEDLKIVQKTVSLRASTIQCIIKLANIVLTPDQPEYTGGKWHVEGMMNEHIVASFIYYYDSENITESRLAFRRATTEPVYHEQDDGFCMRVLYGMDRDDPCFQELGSVLTSQNTCIAFPNIYQHQVQPFRLQDRTKPGHRKILVIFLVDPTIRVPSATDVGPQQYDIIHDILQNPCSNSRLGRLPLEVRYIIADMVDGVFKREEAEKYRLELMDERTVFVDDNTDRHFQHEFNMCEH